MSNIAIYPKGTIDFFSQGYGILSDVVSSETTETASTNGNVSSKLEMQYPVNGYLSDKLIEGNFIRVSMSRDSNDYAIYEITDSLKEDTGTITIYGDPYSDRIGRMSFEHGGQFPGKYQANSVLLQSINDIKDFPAWFKVSTDITKQVDLSENSPYENFSKFLDELNTKVSGKVKYGVNYIRIYSDLGSDRTDIVLRDDMNTTSVKIKTDYSSIVNRIIPLINNKDEKGNITEGTHLGTIVTSDNPHEFIDYWAGSVITVGSQDLANTYFNRTHVNRPTQTVTVTPIDYDEDLANVHLFDRLTVYSSKLGFSSKLRVSERVIDNLTGEVSTFKLGDTSPSIVKTITERNEQLFNKVQQISNTVISANQKNTTYHGNAEPSIPIEGDLWYKEEDGETYLQIYQNGEWIDVVSTKTQKLIEDSVNSALLVANSEAAAMDEQNNISINNTINEVSQEKIDLALKDADFNGKAQEMADKALSDAKANAANVAQEALNSANQNIADAKKSLSDGIASEASARTQAVATVGSQAQSYANQAKSDAMSAASSADGAIRTAISSSANSLSATITQNKSSADSGVSMAQTTAQAAVDGLALKVSKTDYDQKTGDLSTKINDVKQTADSSAQTIADIQEADGKQDTRMSEIENTASGLKTTVSDISTEQDKQSGYISTLQERANGFEATVTKVNNLQVGGRNLLLNSDKNFVLNPTAHPYHYERVYTELIPGKTYTFSAEIESIGSTATGLARIGIYDRPIVKFYTDSNLKADNTRQSFTFTVPKDIQDNATLIVYSGESGKTANLEGIYHHMKLEEGTVPTDWTPAPEDLSSATATAQLTADNAVLDLSNYKTDADGRIKKAQADIEVNANGIKEKVSQSVYDKKTGDLSTKVNTAQQTADEAKQTIGTYKETNDRRVHSAETNIKANSDAIKLTVSKNDYDNNNSQLDRRFTKVEGTANEASTTVGKLQTAVNNLGQINQLFNTEFSPDLQGWSSSNLSNYLDYIDIKGVYNSSHVLHYNGGTASRLDIQSQKIKIENPTQSFSISVLVKGKVGISVVGYKLDSDVAFSSWYTGTSSDSNHSDWTLLTFNNKSISSGSTAEITSIAFNITSTGNEFWLSEPILVFASTVGTYVPGNYNNNEALAQVKITADGVSSIVSDPTTGLTKRVQTAEGTLSEVRGIDIPNLQKATFWQPYSSLNFNDYTKQGSFFFNTTSAKTNGPTDRLSWTYLMVEQGTSDNGRIKQTAWYDGVDGVKITYVRTLNSGTWSPWYANDNDSVATISHTNESIKQEIKDRKDGDGNTLESSKEFTKSSITKYDEGIQSQFTQTANTIYAAISKSNLIANSEFDPTNVGWLKFTNSIGFTPTETVNLTITGSFSDWPIKGGSRLIEYNDTQWIISELAAVNGSEMSASVVAGRVSVPGNITQALDIRIGYFDVNKKLIGSHSMGNPIDGSTYKGLQLYKLENMKPTAGTRYAGLIIAHSGPANDVITQPMLCYGSKALPYSPRYGNDSSSTIIQLQKDNWSIGITNNTGALINGINGDGSNVRIAAKKLIIDQDVTIGGTGWLNGAVIKNASIGSAQIGTIDASDGRIINLDVKYLSGDSTNFVKSKWANAYSNVTIDTSGMEINTNNQFAKLTQGSLVLKSFNNTTNVKENIGWFTHTKAGGANWVDYLSIVLDGYSDNGASGVNHSAVHGADGFSININEGGDGNSRSLIEWDSVQAGNMTNKDRGWHVQDRLYVEQGLYVRGVNEHWRVSWTAWSDWGNYRNVSLTNPNGSAGIAVNGDNLILFGTNKRTDGTRGWNV